MAESTHSHLYRLLLEWLIASRNERALTQQQLADRLNKPQSFVSKYENGERRLDIVEFVQVVAALEKSATRLLTHAIRGATPDQVEQDSTSILDRWEIGEEALTALIDENPSMRGIALGYVAEHKLIELWFSGDRLRYDTKHDDHDRGRKGDHVVIYKKKSFVVESKSLQTNTIKCSEDGTWSGKAQVDASDCRQVTLKGGKKLQTTLLTYGEFDLLAVNCFAFGQGWKFVFAANADLPPSQYRKYSESQRKQLIGSLVKVTWPPEPPFYDSPYPVLDQLCKRK